MILEEETFKAFGYYPKTLFPGNNRPVLALCDNCKEIRIILKNRYRRLCDKCIKKEDVAYIHGS